MVPEPDGSIHICGESEVTVKPALIVDKQPLHFPTREKASLYSKLDLLQAYQSDGTRRHYTKKLLVINTHKGLYTNTQPNCSLNGHLYSESYQTVNLSFALLQDKINTAFWPAVFSTDISQL